MSYKGYNSYSNQHYIQAMYLGAGFGESRSSKSLTSARHRIVAKVSTEDPSIKELRAENVASESGFYGDDSPDSLDHLISKYERNFEPLLRTLWDLPYGTINCDNYSHLKVLIQLVSFMSVRTKESLNFACFNRFETKRTIFTRPITKELFFKNLGQCLMLLSSFNKAMIIKLNDGLGVCPSFVVTCGSKENSCPLYMMYGVPSFNFLRTCITWAFLPLSPEKGLLLHSNIFTLEDFKRNYLTGAVGFASEIYFLKQKTSDKVVSEFSNIGLILSAFNRGLRS